MSNFISFEKAKRMTETYKNIKGEVLKPEHQHFFPHCETFDRSQFDAVLSMSECVSLRIYYGMNEDHVMHSIIVGVNDKGEDIFNLPTVANSTNSSTNTATSTTTTTTTSDSSAIIEDGATCPPTCPSGTGL